MLSIHTLDAIINLQGLYCRYLELRSERLSLRGFNIPIVSDFFYIYLFFKESFKGELFASNRIDFENAMDELEYQNLLPRPNIEEFMSLMREKRKYDDFLETEVENHYSEEFVKYLKQNRKKRELSTLIKLGADEKDCLDAITAEALFDKAEKLSASSRIKKGRDSLQWMSAKAVIKHRIPTQNAPETALDIVNAAQTFYGLENKAELISRKKRRLTPMGII